VPALLADRSRGFDLASLYARLLAMQAVFSTIFGGLESLGKHYLSRFVLNPNPPVRAVLFNPLDGLSFAVKFHALK
jgi:hypothetical protein